MPQERRDVAVVVHQFPDGSAWSSAGNDWAAMAVVAVVSKNRPALKPGEVRPPWEFDPALEPETELGRLRRGLRIDYVIPGE